MAGGQTKRKGQEGRSGGGGGHNKKRYINKGPPSGGKGGVPLGSRGILVSCTNSKEQQAAREAIALFTESYEALGGQWKQQGAAAAAPADADAADAPPTDIAAALASEVAELTDPSKRPFFFHLVGIHSVVFLELKDAEGPSPSQLVLHACQKVAASQQCASRFCSRFYPVEQTCFAGMEKMGELAAAVVAEHFPKGAAEEEAIQFAVQYDARAAPALDRMQVIDLFATLVPPPHKVNLDKPQKTILVNVTKATCGVAVVEQFRELCRYNIRTLAIPEEERERQKAEHQAQQAQQKAEQEAAAAAKQQEQEKEGEGVPVAAAAAEEPKAAAEPAQEEEAVQQQEGAQAEQQVVAAAEAT